MVISRLSIHSIAFSLMMFIHQKASITISLHGSIFPRVVYDEYCLFIEKHRILKIKQVVFFFAKMANSALKDKETLQNYFNNEWGPLQQSHALHKTLRTYSKQKTLLVCHNIGHKHIKYLIAKHSYSLLTCLKHSWVMTISYRFSTVQSSNRPSIPLPYQFFKIQCIP